MSVRLNISPQLMTCFCARRFPWENSVELFSMTWEFSPFFSTYKNCKIFPSTRLRERQTRGEQTATIENKNLGTARPFVNRNNPTLLTKYTKTVNIDRLIVTRCLRKYSLFFCVENPTTDPTLPGYAAT